MGSLRWRISASSVTPPVRNVRATNFSNVLLVEWVSSSCQWRFMCLFVLSAWQQKYYFEEKLVRLTACCCGVMKQQSAYRPTLFLKYVLDCKLTIHHIMVRHRSFCSYYKNELLKKMWQRLFFLPTQLSGSLHFVYILKAPLSYWNSWSAQEKHFLSLLMLFQSTAQLQQAKTKDSTQPLTRLPKGDVHLKGGFV